KQRTRDGTQICVPPSAPPGRKTRSTALEQGRDQTSGVVAWPRQEPTWRARYAPIAESTTIEKFGALRGSGSPSTSATRSAATPPNAAVPRIGAPPPRAQRAAA